MHVCMHVCGTVRGRHKDIHYTHMCVYTYPHRQIPMHVHVFIKERVYSAGQKRELGGKEAGRHAHLRTYLYVQTYCTLVHYVQTYFTLYHILAYVHT